MTLWHCSRLFDVHVPQFTCPLLAYRWYHQEYTVGIGACVRAGPIESLYKEASVRVPFSVMHGH